MHCGAFLKKFILIWSTKVSFFFKIHHNAECLTHWGALLKTSSWFYQTKVSSWKIYRTTENACVNNDGGNAPSNWFERRWEGDRGRVECRLRFCRFDVDRGSLPTTRKCIDNKFRRQIGRLDHPCRQLQRRFSPLLHFSVKKIDS